MKVKKFKASTMQDAMQLVRMELGNDAVILNSKAVKIPKFFGLITRKSVEVIAAVDEEIAVQEVKTRRSFSLMDASETSPTSTPEGKELQSQHRIMESLQEMKSMMKGLTQANHRDPLAPEFFTKLEEKILASELPQSIAEEAINHIYDEWLQNKEMKEEEMFLKLKQVLLSSIADIKFEKDTYSKKFICLVGPTGVGKTTTLAKMAAQASLKHGKKIGFLTTDTYRIAAIEQLKTYANILDAPIEVCYTTEDFQEAKARLAHLDCIFIDTAGRNFLNEQYVNELKQVLHFEEEMKTYLVLSLTSKLVDMKRITEQFWNVGIHSFIFTKKDETTTTSAMFALTHQYEKGAAFLTHGQNVPEDITPLTKEELVDALIEEVKQ